MKKIAVTKAQIRLTKAQENLARISGSRSYPEFESAWSDLLLAGDAIHSILEKGARATPQNRQWFGGKKTERRKDPLLSYMHQARNSEEHGIDPITEEEPGSLTISGNDKHPTAMSGMAVYADGTVVMEVPPGFNPPDVTLKPARARLITVVDERFGTTFAPPMVAYGNGTSGQLSTHCRKIMGRVSRRLAQRSIYSCFAAACIIMKMSVTISSSGSPKNLFCNSLTPASIIAGVISISRSTARPSCGSLPGKLATCIAGETRDS